jgi:hypothetical protein
MLLMPIYQSNVSSRCNSILNIKYETCSIADYTNSIENISLSYKAALTRQGQRQVQISTALILMAESYVFLKKEKVYGETIQLSFCHCILSNILEETLGDNHGTRQHLHPHNADSLHQQTFGSPSYTHQIEFGNFEL